VPDTFSWNGKGIEFIADMIGPGVVGTGLRRRTRRAGSDGIFESSAKSLKERDGK